MTISPVLVARAVYDRCSLRLTTALTAVSCVSRSPGCLGSLLDVIDRDAARARELTRRVLVVRVVEKILKVEPVRRIIPATVAGVTGATRSTTRAKPGLGAAPRAAAAFICQISQARVLAQELALERPLVAPIDIPMTGEPISRTSFVIRHLSEKKERCRTRLPMRYGESFGLFSGHGRANSAPEEATSERHRYPLQRSELYFYFSSGRLKRSAIRIPVWCHLTKRYEVAQYPNASSMKKARRGSRQDRFSPIAIVVAPPSDQQLSGVVVEIGMMSLIPERSRSRASIRRRRGVL
jgi:hypothetical protein